MALQADKSNLIDRFRANRAMASTGFTLEPIGRHNIRVSKAGRTLGIWRQSAGSFAWVPTGQNHPQTSVLSIDDAVRHLRSAYAAN